MSQNYGDTTHDRHRATVHSDKKVQPSRPLHEQGPRLLNNTTTSSMSGTLHFGENLPRRTTGHTQATSPKPSHDAASAFLASRRPTFKTPRPLPDHFCMRRHFTRRSTNCPIHSYGAPTLDVSHATATGQPSSMHPSASPTIKLAHPSATCCLSFRHPAFRRSYQGPYPRCHDKALAILF